MSRNRSKWVARLTRRLGNWVACGCAVLAFLPVLVGVLYVAIFTLAPDREAPPVFVLFATRAFFDPWICAACATLLVGLAFAASRTMRRRWQNEKDRLRKALLDHLGLVPGKASLTEARGRLLALVPCEGRKGGPLAGPEGGRLWLCFLADALVAVAAATGKTAVVPNVRLRKLYLVENARGGSWLAVESESGVDLLAVRRLDDLARVVNVLKKQGITLGYRTHVTTSVR